MIKAVLLDLDGTVYEGNRLITGADEAIRIMRDRGLKVIFCTNNSSRPRNRIAKKIEKMGIPCEKGDVVSSGFIATEYAKSLGTDRLYLCGSDDLRKEFIKNDIHMCEPEDCETLIIGMDTDFDYGKMTMGVRAALHAERIVICNKDRLFPTESGPKPGSGAIVASILSAVDRKEDTILGKPGTAMMKYISETTGFGADEMVVIGDSPGSDGAMAKAYDSTFICVSPEHPLIDAVTRLP